ncbi:carbohydrate ABC transporter permease [Paenibacillus koleovorans]|uniref:carbohydrate ABC transporter permease n=1 Tax=Paenibacillus koleovorans TaxID=121608 RepID=UPI000FD6C5D2|nr:carbohydrate ABC transporter permease [Paenibacillus koleovorans]
MVRPLKESAGERLFRYANVCVMGLLGFMMLVPFLKVLSTSLSAGWAADAGQVSLWPAHFTLASWEKILERESLWHSLFLTVVVTVLGTLLCLLLTSLLAYPLSKAEFRPAKLIVLLIVITLVFRYPLIPYFLTIKNLGLYNNFWVLIIPQLITAYNLIIMRTFFKELPKELEEAAQLEGCGYGRLLFLIVLPTSKAVLATLGIFYAVTLWNQFLHPLLFIDNPNLYPLQLKLREYIISTDAQISVTSDQTALIYSNTTLKAATIIFAAIPILLVYPFMQKHFVKGAMLGSVK